MDFCTLELRNVIARRKVTIDGKETSVQDKTPIATVIADWKKSQEPEP